MTIANGSFTTQRHLTSIRINNNGITAVQYGMATNNRRSPSAAPPTPPHAVSSPPPSLYDIPSRHLSPFILRRHAAFFNMLAGKRESIFTNHVSRQDTR
jgi:hypothetical protein